MIKSRAVSPLLGERWRRIHAYLVPAFVLALLIAIVGWRFWTPIKDARRALAWDAQAEYWGDLAFEIDAVRHGELPLWNPYDRCGYPFAADPQAGVLYPVNWLLVGTGLLAGAKFGLVTAKTLLHLWWLAFGMFVWLRRRGSPESLCYAAGMFCIVAYPINAWFMAINWSLAWLPWILLAIDAWAEAPTRSRAAWLALAVAMCQLAGSPPGLWYALLVAVPYAGFSLWHHGRATDARTYARDVATSGLVALAIVVIAVGGQMLALEQLIPHTIRTKRDLEFIASQGLLPDDLLGVVVPRMPGQNPYLGMIPLLAAGVTLTVRPSGRAYALAAIAAFGLLLCVGPYNVFLSAFASLVPFAGRFRYAQRYAYIVVIPLAALGVEGVAALATLEAQALRDRAARWIAIAGIAGAVVAGIAIVTSARGPQHDAYVFALVAWLAASWVLYQILTSESAWRRRFVELAAFILVLDAWFAHAPDIDAALTSRPTTPHDGELAQLEQVPLGARIFDRMHFKYRAGTRLGIRELGGYEGDPIALERYAKLLDRIYEDPHVMGHANVAYVAGTASLDRREMTLGNDFRAIASDLFRVPDVAPAVAWYPAAEAVANEAEAMAALRGTRPGTGAIVEQASADPRVLALPPSSASPVAGRIVRLRRNTLVAEVDAPAAGVVVIAEMVHPGWRATIDGTPARVFPANGAFRGLFVDAGHHRIAMEFHIGIAGWLMLLSPLGLAFGLLLVLRRTKPEP